MSILDCNIPVIVKGLEAIKKFDEIINSDPELKKIIGNVKVYLVDGDEDCNFKVGHWEYMDDCAFEFYENT